jgi:hypothetical protein
MPSAPMEVHETSGREVPGTRTICAECQGDVFRFYDLDGHNHMLSGLWHTSQQG